MAERDRLRLAAVLAADAELEVVADAAAALDGDPHQVADAVLVDRLERVALEDAVLEVVRQEAAGVVAREAERGLREVVRAEGEEVGVLGDLVGPDARPRQLDHRPDEVLELALLGHRPHGQLAQAAQLLAEPDERVHDLDERRPPGSLRHRERRTRDRPHLHLVDLGVEEPEAARAPAEHRVRLLQARGSARAGARRCASSSEGRNSCSGQSSSRIVTG